MIGNCPAPGKLKSLSLGQLSEEQSDVLILHLESCESCQSEIAQFDSTDDSLVQQFKSSTANADNTFETESGCRVAMTRALAALATVENEPAHPPSQLQTAIPNTIGEYEIVRPLGHGGMGHVYLGKHTKLNRSVAIKFVADHRRWDKTMHERFESEMRLIGGLKHPNIVVAHDAREVDGIAVLVTEFIDGMTLSEILKRTENINVNDAAKIIAEVCQALQYIETKGMVHRDIKPSNIMVDKDGNVKLLDLGLARIQQPDDNTANNFTAVDFTATGQAIGTADYVSPEQIKDGRNVDIRADIYGLGCTFYKLLTGQAPFVEHPSVFSKLNAHVSENPVSLKTSKAVPVKIANLVDSMLAKAPNDRPQHPTEISQRLQSHSAVADLKELVATAQALPIQKRTTPQVSSAKPQPQPSFVSKFPWTVALVAAAVAGLLGFLLGITITLKKPDGITASVEIPAGSTAIVDSEGNVEIQLAGSKEKTRIDKANVKLSSNAFEKKATIESTAATAVIVDSESDELAGASETQQIERADTKLSKDAISATTIKMLEHACKAYKLSVGAFPAQLDDLVIKPAELTMLEWGGPYLEKKVPRDPWNRAYNYSVDESNNRVEILSIGLLSNDVIDDMSHVYYAVPSDSSIYGKVDKGDTIDIYLVDKKAQDEYGRVGRLIHSNVKVDVLFGELGTESKGVLAFEKSPKKNSSKHIQLMKLLRNKEVDLRFEFHNPNNQLVEDGLRLNGVWKNILMQLNGEVSDTDAGSTLVIRNNQMRYLAGDVHSGWIKFKLKPGNYLEVDKESALKMKYRFLKSGRLELHQARGTKTRWQRVETPVSNDEKTAFKLLAKANSNPGYFRCYIAKSIESRNASSHPIEGTSKHVELIGEPVINRNHVQSAEIVNDVNGRLSLALTLTPMGAMRMRLATKANVGKQMALLIDGKVRLAPNIVSTVSRRIEVTGDLTNPELDAITEALVGRVELPTVELPTKASYPKTATQTKSLDNLKELMLALFDYESAHQKFPTSKMKPGATSPPMSWRVALLPMLGHQELFDQYKPNEPWDSEANTKVLNQMPAIFRHPTSPADSTETDYLGVAGKHGAFGIEKSKGFGSVTDGTIDSIFMVELKSGIPWTKPEDLSLDSLEWKSSAQFKKTFSKLEFFDPEVICIGMGDSSAFMLDRKKLQAEIDQPANAAPEWLNLFSIDDGKATSLQQYEAKPEGRIMPGELLFDPAP